MFNQYLFLSLFALLFVVNVSVAAPNGFDEVCTIYTEAKNSNMSVDVSSKYIMDNIKKRVSSKDALKTHDAIMSAMGDVRYKLFKESSEHYLKRKWECPAMQHLMSTRKKQH